MAYMTDEEINSFENDITKYFNITAAKNILSQLVAQNGPEVYLDDEKLYGLLRTMGMETMDAHRVCMVASITMFKKMVANKNTTPVRADFNSLVENSILDTGMSRFAAYGVVSALCYSLGWTLELQSIAEDGIRVSSFDKAGEKIISLPYSAYKSDIDSLKKLRLKKDEESTKDYLESLNYYSKMGLPIGKYMLARTMEITDENSSGFKLMKTAADEGNAMANIYLGNLYYDKGKAFWGKAYSYFNSYGRWALRPGDRKRLVDIINLREYNKKMLAAMIVLTVISLLWLICMPTFAVYSINLLVGIGSVVIEAIVATVAVMKYRKDQFTDISKISILNYTIWIVAMIISIGF